MAKTKFEDLPPNALKVLIEELLCTLKKELVKKQTELEKAPQGSLHVSRSGKYVQYYHLTKGCGKTGRYLKKSTAENRAFIVALAQKAYDKDAVTALQSEITLMQHFLAKSRFCGRFMPRINKRKLSLVEPMTLSDDAYAARWKQMAFEQKAFRETDRGFLSSDGLRVRSKSELIIARALKQNHIPFRYEPRLKLQDRSVYPDFVCLNVRTRAEFVWEHLGLLDDAEYAQKAVKKLRGYQASGWFPGQNLIITLETKECALDEQAMQQVIAAYLA